MRRCIPSRSQKGMCNCCCDYLLLWQGKYERLDNNLIEDRNRNSKQSQSQFVTTITDIIAARKNSQTSEHTGSRRSQYGAHRLNYCSRNGDLNSLVLQLQFEGKKGKGF